MNVRIAVAWPIGGTPPDRVAGTRANELGVHFFDGFSDCVATRGDEVSDRLRIFCHPERERGSGVRRVSRFRRCVPPSRPAPSRSLP